MRCGVGCPLNGTSKVWSSYIFRRLTDFGVSLGINRARSRAQVRASLTGTVSGSQTSISEPRPSQAQRTVYRWQSYPRRSAWQDGRETGNEDLLPRDVLFLFLSSKIGSKWIAAVSLRDSEQGGLLYPPSSSQVLTCLSCSGA